MHREGPRGAGRPEPQPRHRPPAARATLAALSVALAATLGLSACGGSGGGNTTPPPPAPETLYVPANSWTGPLPAGAETISAEEFRRRITSGEAELVLPDAAATQRARRQQQLAADLAYLDTLGPLSPTLTTLRDAARTDSSTDPQMTLEDGRTVRLNGPATQLREAVEAERAARDPAAARAAYALVYDRLSAAERGTLPTPASLATADLATVKAARAQLSQALEQQPNLDNVRAEPEAAAAGGFAPLSAGNGSDTASCTPNNFHRRFWYPLKNFQPPMRNQGARGTCWAFAAVGAVEIRQRVQNDEFIDLSEQAFVNKVKNEWDPAEFVDGYGAERALALAVQNNYGFARENLWTYNPAYQRAGGDGDNEARYAGTCNGYTGWCSNTAHQSPRSCTTLGLLTYCQTTRLSFTGGTVAASGTTPLWASSDGPLPLGEIRRLLAAGVPILATMPVHIGLRRPVEGVITDERTVYLDNDDKEQPGYRSSHVVLIVGYLPNEAMSFPWAPVNAPGGGYFIIRNSWGCGGDGGYYYASVGYVLKTFLQLSALAFDDQRNAAWSREQVFPGAASPLSVTAGGSFTAGLRVPTDLARATLSNGQVVPRFTVAHDTAAYVRLTLRSDEDGLLFDGQWPVNANPGGSFSRNLPATFATPGARTVTVTATYGNVSNSAAFRIDAVNQNPTITVPPPAAVVQGEAVQLLASVSDPNEPDASGLCSRMTWNVAAPDEALEGTGCAARLRFNATGERSVSVRTTDGDGGVAVTRFTLQVNPPPANPYPRLLSAGVLARNKQLVGGSQLGCRNDSVAAGSTIDLRQAGCSTFSVDPVVPPRYFAGVSVENPAGEALTYDWELRVYGIFGPPTRATARTTLPSWDLQPVIFGALDTAYTCEVAVAVNAPDPARSKPMTTVWNGRCINEPSVPR